MRPLVRLEIIANRLPTIFPEGTPNRGKCVSDAAARTIFTMLFLDAVEGSERWLAPKQVYRMSDPAAARDSNADRDRYWRESMNPRYRAEGAPWYADNTRESIRDDSLRDGLVPTGAVIVNHSVPTTSSRGRYALAADFADLFRPELTPAALESAVADWQSAHLSSGALARIQILRRGAVSLEHSVKVHFPNGEVRQMAAGPSSLISKGVIEEFTARFCEQPAVIWLSESGAKVIARDDALAASIGLNIDASRLLQGLAAEKLARVDGVETCGPGNQLTFA